MKCALIAAVLKPANDVRMYHKLGKYIAEKYDKVHILGYSSAQPKDSPSNIYFYPIFNFQRLQLRRWLAGWTFFRLAYRLQPNLLIVSAVELLPWAMLYRLFAKVKIIYDVREDYFSNIYHQNHYPLWLRLPLAQSVRLCEWISRSFVSEYWLAERSYAQSCTFTKARFRIIENKAIQNHFQKPIKQSLKTHFKAVIVGNFSDTYGTLKALQWFAPYLAKGATLSIVGKASDKHYKDKIIAYCANYPKSIYIHINTKPIAWEDIQQVMQKADILLLPYTQNLSTQYCIPTKVFEALAMHLPMVLPKNPLWQSLLNPYNAAFFTDFEDFAYKPQIFDTIFYTKAPPAAVYDWTHEAQKLDSFIAE
ncbi:MAG: glycosyltransferase [Bernardetiaceae bacterium]|nr:glycosyltransferase [Bernardetiaceae bacterium]